MEGRAELEPIKAFVSLNFRFPISWTLIYF